MKRKRATNAHKPTYAFTVNMERVSDSHGKISCVWKQLHSILFGTLGAHLGDEEAYGIAVDHWRSGGLGDVVAHRSLIEAEVPNRIRSLLQWFHSWGRAGSVCNTVKHLALFPEAKKKKIEIIILF